MSLSKEPAFTPTLIGIFANNASLATSLICFSSLIFPGFKRKPWTPASIAANASLYWKCISAIIGTGLLVDISINEVAASTSLHVTLTISAPLLASS